MLTGSQLFMVQTCLAYSSSIQSSSSPHQREATECWAAWATGWEEKLGWPISVGLDWEGNRSCLGSRSLKEKPLEAGSGRRGGEDGR